jgi:hypothetical protein
VQRNFSLASVLTILGMCAAFGSYIASLKTRVVVLETEVVHITKIVPDSSMLGALRDKADEHEKRITRLEQNQDEIDWDYIRNQPPAHHK